MRCVSRGLTLFLSIAAIGCTIDAEPAGDAVAGDGLAGEPGPGTSEAVRCGDGPTVFGVDVSYFQGAINWAGVRGAGARYAFIRVSDGLGFRDPRFADNWAGARAAGVLRGAYQFFRPAQDPIAQADLLADAVGSLATDDLPPVIDVEATAGLSGQAVAARVGQWISRIEQRLGRRPIVYTGKYFWQDNVANSSAFADHPLWVAQYTPAACPNLPNAWSDWTFWQYSDSGSVAGIAGPVDVNRFNGDLAALQALAGGGAGGGRAIEVYWHRDAGGTYQLRALAPAEISRVVYRVDSYDIGSASRADGDNFPTSYRFNLASSERLFEVIGFDDAGRELGRGVGLIDVTDGVAVYIKQMGDALYELGLERAPAGVAAIEVRADSYLLRDSVSGETRSPRGAVRSRFNQLGERRFRITTFNADGTVRGHLYRTFTLR